MLSGLDNSPKAVGNAEHGRPALSVCLLKADAQFSVELGIGA